ncbi:hypothetical protein O181_010451 [Austropuccinia psidii MF-1]|uniref:Integrase catalytic domain-containing protein n=1 Tax=Austropuccinia psidii MF-1 TaxID=1389203 RepID=A0A9Q3BTT2_9BASI|nr:hypothetical protein [Austropuccinia psidii MF-1]
MDFIIQLPLFNSFDSIIVAVDRFSKMEIFIPAYGTITALELSQIFISHVFSKHGLPKKRINQILEQYIGISVSYHQDDWDTLHPLAKFAYNNAEHSPTKQSPFFTIDGGNPSFDSIHISQDLPAGKVSTKLQTTLVHLATSLCLEPVTESRYQYSFQARNSFHSQSEYPEVPSIVGVSETGNSFRKGPSF